MRVLVVTTWFPTPSSPSTGSFVARDVEAIATRHHVHVLHLCAPRLLTHGDPGPEVPGTGGRVSLERLAMDPRRPDHVLRARRRVLELTRHADLLHTMAVSALLPTTGPRPAVPWVHTEHWSGLMAPETLTLGLRGARLAVRHLLARPDVVVVVGEELAAGVRRLRTGPVVVVPNIVTAPEELSARRRPEVPLTDPGRGVAGLVGVGGLIDRKDPLTAVATVAELRARGADARLTWVGEGPLRAAVVRAADASGVPLRLTGDITPDEVQPLVADADVFLLPTRAETFCVAAAEALAAGRPVVVGDTSGPRDFVGPPSGALVAPGAPAMTWADAVEGAWRSSAGLTASAIAAPVLERYGAHRYAERVDAVYRSLLPAPDGPVVDVVVAVHSAQRRTERAVRSVLDGSGALADRVRVTVVCHNLSAGEVAGSFSARTREDPRVRLLELRDGIPSPSGPFNAGLDAATAPWVSVLGSDDTLAPGAIPAWLEAAEGLDPAEPVVVLAPLELAGRPVPTPPVRPARRAGAPLDLVRDRLSYRSAPLGLLSRGALRLPGARLLPQAEVGGDVPMVTALWARARVLRAPGAPAYRIHEDAPDRVTYAPRPVAAQLRSVDMLWDLPWVRDLTTRQRRAVATKVLRIHVFGAVLTRSDPGWWSVAERRALADLTRRTLDAAPGAADPLSRADHDLLAAVLDPTVPAAVLLARARDRRRHGRPRTLLPSSWRHVLHREAPLRFMASSLAARRR
ncbi:glycosyltransferase [Ornithinimicrobium sp. LYQ121]|uniref:glycosyltransferase n=1 Tax=Ornithinimicrobium sp. LYQ121 TaxID=3378801 RepID=UPI0038546159